MATLKKHSRGEIHPVIVDGKLVAAAEIVSIERGKIRIRWSTDIGEAKRMIEESENKS